MPDRKALSKAMEEALKEVEENQKADSIYGIREGGAPLASWPTTPAKIIFLDFDGVMNSDISGQTLGTKHQFSAPCIAALNELLKDPDLLLVITSTWREVWSLKDIAKYLKQDGLVGGRVVGKTPMLGKERGWEIDNWLRTVPFGVGSFVILDDHDDMAMHRDRLVQANSRFGLTMKDAERAREVLRKPLVLNKR